MLLRNEDVRDRALMGHAFEGVLDVGSLGCASDVSECSTCHFLLSLLTVLVKLDRIELCAHLGQEALSRFAVRAVGFGEDGCTRCQRTSCASSG